MAVFSGNGSNTSPSFTFSSDTDTGMYRGTGPDTLFFTTNGDNAIEITSSQFVGVAISPLERFSVAGGSMLVDDTIPQTSNQSAPYLKVGQTSYTGAVTNSDTFGLQHWMKSDSTGRPRLTIEASPSGTQTEIYSITDDGRVFIGQPSTTSLTYKLDVKTVNYGSGQTGGIRFGEGGANPNRAALRLMQKVSGVGIPYAEIIGPVDNNGFTAFSNGSSSTEVFRSTANLYLRMASGTGGIQFNGDSAGANALDDYEEGTYTPAAAGFGSLTGGTFSTANYTKIGKLVVVTNINGTALTYDGGSGARCFITLPFTPQSGIFPAVGHIATSTIWKIPLAYNSGGSVGASIQDEAGNYLTGLSAGKPTELKMSIAYFV